MTVQRRLCSVEEAVLQAVSLLGRVTTYEVTHKTPDALYKATSPNTTHKLHVADCIALAARLRADGHPEHIVAAIEGAVEAATDVASATPECTVQHCLQVAAEAGRTADTLRRALVDDDVSADEAQELLACAQRGRAAYAALERAARQRIQTKGKPKRAA